MRFRELRVSTAVWRGLFRQAVMRDLQFRAQAWLHLLASIGELSVGVLPVLILTNYIGFNPAIAHISVVTVGVFAMTSGLMDCFMSPGLRRFDSAIRQGELDLALVRPVPTFFYAIMRWIQPTELAKCLTGAAVVGIAYATFHLPFDLGGVLVMMAWAFGGTVAYCTFWADLALLAFWVKSIEPVNDLVLAWRGAGQYPRVFFPRTFQVLLVSLAPAALSGSYPAEQLLQPAKTAILLPLVVIVSCAVTAAIWRCGLRHYDSASS